VTSTRDEWRDTLRRLHLARWLPILAMIVLIVVIGAYTNSQDSAFTSEFNLNGMLVATMPLACAAMGQTFALMVRAFDVSMGSLMSVLVVTGSFVLGPDEAWWSMGLGIGLIMLVAIASASVNVTLIRGLGLSSIIATLAMLSILDGVALWLRPQPAGPINRELVDLLKKSVGFVPVAFIVIVVVALAADVWLYRSAGGLSARAAGLDEVSAERRGVRVGFLYVRAFFIAALAAAVGSLFLAAQIQIGDPRIGVPFTFEAIAAAVLGGASIFGGRGSFFGAVVGALFLRLLINVLPFLDVRTPILSDLMRDGRIFIGVLTLTALVIYQAPELTARIRTAIANFRLARGHEVALEETA
jgi:ribose transport system ATP-binding protein